MSQTRPIDEHSMHTRTCGELRRENVGEEVTLTGWVSRRRDHGGLIFCDLRDREGITQLTFDPEHSDGDAFKIAETMRPEWPIKIHGVVRARGEETTNTKLATGEIEVLTDHAEVLNTSVTPPFQIEDGIETSEDTRLRYRYLDLRRPEMMANLKLRSDFTFAIREALHNREFMEVETPSLFKSTPEAPRLHRSQPHPAGQLLRPAAVPAASEAAAYGRWRRALLSGCQVLPRRGPACRPSARVHPGRYRDVLR